MFFRGFTAKHYTILTYRIESWQIWQVTHFTFIERLYKLLLQCEAIFHSPLCVAHDIVSTCFRQMLHLFTAQIWLLGNATMWYVRLAVYAVDT